jgi:hypothetical protein
MIIEIELSPKQIEALGYRPPPSTFKPVTFRLQSDGTWRSLDQRLTIERPLVVGTLGGRHDKINADYYLAGKVTPGQPAFDFVYDRMVEICQFAPNVEIHLMYTGLTETTLAAYSALLAHNMRFTVLRFDDRAHGYVPLDITKFLHDLSR